MDSKNKGSRMLWKDMGKEWKKRMNETEKIPIGNGQGVRKREVPLGTSYRVNNTAVAGTHIKPVREACER